MNLKRQGFIAVVAVIVLIIAATSGCAPQQEGEEQSGSVGEQFNYEITGIDPGAGLMTSTVKAIEEYNLEGWELIESSDAAMTAALSSAYRDEKPIIVTGWTPHWKFAEYDLKYLDDPKNVYGGDEDINTIARKGLKEDHPSAYEFLDNFNWEPSDMETVMVEALDSDFETASANWVENNSDKVDTWVEGIEPVDGDNLSLTYVAWDSELSSTNVVKVVLEERLGYNVEMTQLDPGAMFASISTGDSDAMVAAWLPTTHADYYERFSDDFEDLGPNLTGTRIGLVVPTYVEIDSIEDLNK